MAHIGTAVLCDRLYGGRARLFEKDLTRKDGDETLLLDRQALHARRIQFAHPVTSEVKEVEAPLPEDLTRTLKALRAHRSH
jgi:23S rRNA pseudouridine1911/1915/1917 synthase